MNLAGRAAVEVYPELGGFQKELAAQLAPITAKMGRFSKGSVAGLAAVATAAGAATTGLYKIGETYDDATDTIRVATGATGKNLAKLKDDFKNVYGSVPSDSKAVADAVGTLNSRLQITGQPLQRISKQFLDLSRITGTDLDTNIKNITRAFKDASIPTKKQSSALDQLFVAHQKTGVAVADLTDNMVKFGAPLRTLGFNFTQSGAMLAKFEQAGVNIQTTMPGLRMAIKNFAAAGREPGKALKETFTQVEKAPTSLAAYGKAVDVFGTRSTSDMVDAIRAGRFSYRDLITEMKDGKGAIGDAAKDTNDLSENWKIFQHRLSNAVEPVASFVFDKINSGLSTVLQNSKIAVPAIGALAAAIGVATVAQLGLNVAAMLNPYVALAAGVAAAAVGLVTLYKRSKAFRQIVDSVSSAVKTGAVAAFAALKVAAVDAGQWVTNAFHNVKSAIADGAQWISQAKSNISGFVSSLLPIKLVMAAIGLQFKGLASIASPVFDALKAGVSVAGAGFSAFAPVLKSVGSIVATTIGGGFRNASIVLKGFGNAVGNVVGIVSNLLRGDFHGAWKNAKELVVGVVGTIKDSFSSILGTVKSVASKIPGLIGSVVKGIAGVGANIGQLIIDYINDHTIFGNNIHIGIPGPVPDVDVDIPALARGGKVMAPQYVVGEEAPSHPEYVIASNPAYRSRNLGLWASAGKDLGVPGFATGGIVKGRVSYFGGGTMASGLNTDSSPGIALNHKPGTDAGWNDALAHKWLKARQKFAVTIKGHKATLPVLDLGPSGFVNRAIDVDMAALKPLGFNGGNFPTDAIGTAKMIGGSAIKTGKGKGTDRAKGLKLIPNLQKRIDGMSFQADRAADFAQRAETISDAVSGFDQLQWLQQELTALMQLRNLLLTALERLKAMFSSVQGQVKAKVGKTSIAGIGSHGENDGFSKSGLVAGGGGSSGQIASWVAGALNWAKFKGVKFSPTSGYRTPAQNKAAGGAANSRHLYHDYPMGAVDFGGFVSPAAKAMKMAVVNATKDYKWPLKAPVGFSDDGHASGDGHFMGGILGLPPGHKLPGFKTGAGKGATSKAAKAATANIKKQTAAITQKISDTTSALTELQGIGSPMGPGPFKLGDLGGRILDVQSSIKDFGANATGGTPGLSISDLRNIVALKGLGVKFNQDQFAGVFHKGGVVPGPYGQEKVAIVKGGEPIFTREQAAALAPVGSPNVTVVVEDGAVDRSKIRVIADEAIDDHNRYERLAERAGA